MKTISPEYRQFVHEHAPRFVQTLRAARQTRKSATMDLEDFDDNPFLLYAALWYAVSEGFDLVLKSTPPAPKRSHPLSA